MPNVLRPLVRFAEGHLRILPQAGGWPAANREEIQMNLAMRSRVIEFTGGRLLFTQALPLILQ